DPGAKLPVQLGRLEVAFALERVLGTLEGEAFFLEQATHLVVAEADSGLLGEVLGQARGAPGGETVAQSQRAGSHRLTQAGAEVVGGAAGPARAVAWMQGVDAALTVQTTDALDGVGGAAQEVGQLRDRAARMGAQDDQAVAEHFRRGRAETQPVQGVKLLVAQRDQVSHNDLLTWPIGPSGFNIVSQGLAESFCVST